MKRKLTAIIAALCLTVALIPSASAATSYIKSGSNLRGSDYTGVPALASKLDAVFSGHPALYSDIACSQPVEAAIGSRTVPPGRAYYVRDGLGNVYSGTSCYIYANAVYSALFGDIPYHGEPGTWLSSRLALKNAARASFELFSSANVTCGALLRTTANSDGSYNSSRGHSVIILKYSPSNITYLEGNGDGDGLIRVTTRDWDTFNSVCVSGRGYRISFIVQPSSGATTGAAKRDLVGYFSLSGFQPPRDVPSGAWYADAVGTVLGLGLMEGRGNAVFTPEAKVTAAEAVTVCARYLSFYYDDRYDLSGSPWYEPSYKYLALWGIDTSFAEPWEPITRAELAALCDRAMPDGARTSVSAVPVFPDVPVSAGWAGPIYSLARTGVIRGGDGLFRPDASLTRAEAACVFARMADRSLR